MTNLLDLNYDLKKEKIELEMEKRRWKKYKTFGRKMSKKETDLYRKRYRRSGLYGFERDEK